MDERSDEDMLVFLLQQLSGLEKKKSGLNKNREKSDSVTLKVAQSSSNTP